MNQDKTIRILQIMPGGHVCGGIEMFVMNYYRRLVNQGVQFDFLFHYKEKGYFDDEIKSLGGEIYYFSIREDKNILKYIYQLFKFFAKHREYKIIHGHMPGMGPIYFFVAMLCGIKVRISHAHVTETEKTLKGNILKRIIKIIPFLSNTYCACSNAAGKFMYGSRSFKVINNAIDTDKFVFNEYKRLILRKELNIENDFVVGHIGRFNIQKNHMFLLNVFSEILKLNGKSKLLLVGEGPEENSIRRKAKDLGIESQVIFLGTRNDVCDLYNVMDCFVLPSIFEGLPIVGIEAQCNGLPSFFSDEITDELGVSDLANFLSLEDDERFWAKEILEKSYVSRVDMKEFIMSADFDICKEAKKLKNYYCSLSKNC